MTPKEDFLPTINTRKLAIFVTSGLQVFITLFGSTRKCHKLRGVGVGKNSCTGTTMYKVKGCWDGEDKEGVVSLKAKSALSF